VGKVVDPGRTGARKLYPEGVVQSAGGSIGDRALTTSRGGRVGTPPAGETCVAIDAMALRRGGRGIARSLKHLVPLLSAKGDGLRYVTLTSAEGRELLRGVDANIVTVPAMPKSLWEMVGLPFYASKVGARLIFSRSECGTLWGPPLALHVPEDPYIRWSAAPTRVLSREELRRTYQRLTMRPSIRRALVIIASCQVTEKRLRDRFGSAIRRTEIVALGVDNTLFYPDPANDTAGSIFHLGSAETRDQSPLIVEAYALAVEAAPNLPPLEIAGDLGESGTAVAETAGRLGIAERVHLLGRVDDDELRHHYASAVACVQPSRYEGFGLQPLEALACGAPLVVTPEAAVQEVVGDAALFAANDSPAAIAEVLVKVWKDRALREALRARGPRRAGEYTWATTAEKVHALLLTLAAEL
jgi:glycosyltransferase involved in cell wall biosynthesis